MKDKEIIIGDRPFDVSEIDIQKALTTAQETLKRHQGYLDGSEGELFKNLAKLVIPRVETLITIIQSTPPEEMVSTIKKIYDTAWELEKSGHNIEIGSTLTAKFPNLMDLNIIFESKPWGYRIQQIYSAAISIKNRSSNNNPDF